jgi:hypothetical protein
MLRRGVLSKLSLAALLLAALLSAMPALADTPPADSRKCLNAACFPETVSVSGVVLKLRSIYLFEYFTFDVYTVALYSVPGVSADDVLLPRTPKLLELYYHRELHAKDIQERGEALLSKDPEVDFLRLSARIKTIGNLYVDVKAGDRYALSYVPGMGTELSFNGTSAGKIPGDDFSAYFRLWLSKHGFSKKLANALLTDGLNVSDESR